MDQICKIHNICGTPSDSTLEKFKQAPNANIPFQFPLRDPVSLKKLIPNKSSEVCDLIEKLLIYDPDLRISASEALQHPCLREIFDCEKKWIHENRPCPFPYFFQQSIHQLNSSPEASFPLNQGAIEELDNLEKPHIDDLSSNGKSNQNYSKKVSFEINQIQQFPIISGNSQNPPPVHSKSKLVSDQTSSKTSNLKVALGQKPLIKKPNLPPPQNFLETTKKAIGKVTSFKKQQQT